MSNENTFSQPNWSNPQFQNNPNFGQAPVQNQGQHQFQNAPQFNQQPNQFQNAPQFTQQPQQQIQPNNNAALPQTHQFNNNEIPAFLRPTPTQEEQLAAQQPVENYPAVGNDPRAVAGVSVNPWEEILANVPDGRFVGVVSCGGNNMLIGKMRDNIIMADATSIDAVSAVRAEEIKAALDHGQLTSIYWQPGYPDGLFVKQPISQPAQQQVQSQQPVQSQQQAPVQQPQVQHKDPDPVGKAIADNAPSWSTPPQNQNPETKPEVVEEVKKGSDVKPTEKATRKAASKTVSVKVRGMLDRIMELELELAAERAKLMHAVMNDE